MLTVSDHSISANSFTADQLSDVAVIWASAICCRLPDFTPYLLTFTVFFFSSPPHFSRLLPVGFCVLSQDEAVNEISDGGWGESWPRALRAFQLFFCFSGWSDEVRVTFSQSGRKTKGRTSLPLSCPAAVQHAIGHGLFVKRWLLQNPISWRFHNIKIAK